MLSLIETSPVWLAPMAGYTDQAMRHVFRDYGKGLFYTEVSVAQGIVRHAAPTWHLLACDRVERPVAAHIYGAEPGVMAEAARMLEASGNFATIDINCGCPVRKIVAKGAGAALIRTPAQIEAIVRAVAEAVTLPVTVKTRIGYAEGNDCAMEILHRVEDAGAAAIAFHGRFAEHHHKGAADWGLIATIKEHAGIPVIGNGGLRTAQQAVHALQQYGVDAVMIARGAVGNPWILADTEALLLGHPIPQRDYEVLRDCIERHVHALLQQKEKERSWRRHKTMDVDRATALQFRCHLIQYLAGLENWADIRRQFSAIASCKDIFAMVDIVIARQTKPWHELYGMRGA